MCRSLLIFLFAAGFLNGQAGPDNAPPQIDKPYVLLVSFDGFRYDYVAKYGAANLLRFGQQGIAAKALIPSYPSSTFPNHYTIVTGMYPAHHGIVDNNFFDTSRDQLFRFTNAATGGDGSWYGGTPIWTLAEKQGMRTACYFWPGSDTEIQGSRPTHYVKYDGKVPNSQRIKQVVDWFKLPKEQRPHFVTLYLSDVDHAAHSFGPDSEDVRDAVSVVDRAIPELLAGLKTSGVPVNVFIVSDHGMLAVKGEVNIRRQADLDGFQIASDSSQVMLYSKDRELVDKTYSALKGKDVRYEVYRRAETPESWHYRDNPRVGDLVVSANAPVLISAPLPDARPRPGPKGMHGYDPESFPEMRGIFFAQGPDLKTGLTIEPFENIHIFPLIVRLLGLDPPEGVDGSIDVLDPILRDKTKEVTPQ